MTEAHAPPPAEDTQVVPSTRSAPPVGPPGTINIGRRVFATAVALFGLAVLAGLGFAAYSYGESTRQSESEVASRVTRAVTVRSDRAKVDEGLAVKHAEHAQRKADAKKWTKRMDKAVKKAHDQGYSSGSSAGYSSGNAAGYSSGNAAGYSSGHESGVQDGLVEGSDELTCSDDLDVPLPACDY